MDERGHIVVEPVRRKEPSVNTIDRKALTMDSSPLDTLASSLPSARSRRGAFAALLGASLGLPHLAATTAKKKKGKKGKGKNAQPGLADLAIEVQEGDVITVNSSPTSFGSKTFDCPPGGVITSVLTDLRGDVTGLSFVDVSSTGPGNLTVRYNRDSPSAVPAQFVATVICLVAS
jgi:hypothetical protein